MFAPRFQPHGTPLICCTDLLPHTPTPTNTPPGDGTSLNWMPLRAASACRPGRERTGIIAPHLDLTADEIFSEVARVAATLPPAVSTDLISSAGD